MTRFVAVCRSVARQPGFAGLLAANFALGLGYSFVNPFLSMWGTLSIGMRPLTFGLFMTITSVSAVVLSTLLARWSDTHVPRRTMLIVGSSGGVIGYAGYAFVRDPVLLTLIGSFALGVASVNFSQLFAFVREELARPENAGADAALHMSLLRVFFSLAWTIGPATGAAVMIHFSYRGIFLATSALFVLFLLGVLRWVPLRAHPPVAHRVAPASLVAVFTRPIILVHFVGFVLVFAGFTMNMMNLPLLVTQQLGGTEREVGLIFGIAPIVEIPLYVWFGRLAARGHQIGLLRFGVLAAVAYFLALTFARAPWHIYPMQILSAASIAVTTNVTIMFFQDRLPGQAGLATSVYSNSFAAGNLLGYFSFGLLVSVIGHRGVFFACAALCTTTLVAFLLFRHEPPVTARA
ncbi:sugar efflux transporter [Opitutus terrae]|uniref:Major facilitator superfamily MFS_1 n=1 Tax=Opitutus terrae (strain DSM 11246 / JCM 15787 / PB90-1) TaxID=452637 RepID=B1ZNB6_OPITP|nr:sugar efflux transporter [Opitutus terrae]ACB73485.1 major facilitator superfamily MFS_1 [Opitutus terrae PB90-1]